MHPKPQFFLVEQDMPWTAWIESSLDTHLDWAALMDLGAIYCNGKRRTEPLPLIKGDVLRLHPQPRRYPRPVKDFKNQIKGETADHWILWKPPGVPVHPTLDNRKENLLSWCQEDFGQKLYITHRLDIGTEGLIVLAKNPKAQSHFNQMLMRSKVRKLYRAVGAGNPRDPGPPLGTWIHWMKDSDRAPKILSESDPGAGWLRCESKALQISVLTPGILSVELQLITGRTHQIRAQMASWGFPLLGDTLYGGPPLPPSESDLGPQDSSPARGDQWALTCVSVGFPHQGEFKEWTQTSEGRIEFHHRRLEDNPLHFESAD